MNLRTLLLPALACLAPFGTSQEESAIAPRVPQLEKARDAAQRERWSELGEDLAFEGEQDAQDMLTPFTLRFARDGRFRFEPKGPLAGPTAWDGDVLWSRERRGPVLIQGCGEDAMMVLAQWVHSGFWLEPQAPIEVRPLPDSKVPTFELFVPGSGIRARLDLDPQTWLPHFLTEGVGTHASSLTYGDYRPVAGIPIAHEVVRRQAHHVGTLRIESSKSIATDAGTYALPTKRAEDTNFYPDLGNEVELRRVQSGHLIVKPYIDGEEVGWFILDTGAGRLCIDPVVAEQLEMPSFGKVLAVGTAGSVDAGFRQGESLELGPVEIERPIYVELDLSFLEPSFGVPVAGICGYDLFARTVVELDLETLDLALHDPANYGLEGGSWSELTVRDKLPTVRCSFEGDHDGLFKIDTGANHAVLFFTPAVEQYDLLDGRTLRTTTIGGVGGSQSASTGQLEWFALGGRRFEAVNATFATTDVGIVSGGAVLGNLGNELLQPFRIVFNYPAGQIAFLPK